MKERPILFSGPMVRGILDGRKTQTRRAVKLPVIDRNGCGCEIAGCEINSCLKQGMELCPHGVPGDRLWCKETFIPKASGTIYRVDIDDTEAAGLSGMYGGWKPSIFMPRKLSRITLEIASIRVERLQDISDEDAIAEGLYPNSFYRRAPLPLYTWDGFQGNSTSPRYAYQLLWESINGDGSWDSNPWVWVITFKRI